MVSFQRLIIFRFWIMHSCILFVRVCYVIKVNCFFKGRSKRGVLAPPPDGRHRQLWAWYSFPQWVCWPSVSLPQSVCRPATNTDCVLVGFVRYVSWWCVWYETLGWVSVTLSSIISRIHIPKKVRSNILEEKVWHILEDLHQFWNPQGVLPQIMLTEMCCGNWLFFHAQNP